MASLSDDLRWSHRSSSRRLLPEVVLNILGSVPRRLSGLLAGLREVEFSAHGLLLTQSLEDWWREQRRGLCLAYDCIRTPRRVTVFATPTHERYLQQGHRLDRRDQCCRMDGMLTSSQQATDQDAASVPVTNLTAEVARSFGCSTERETWVKTTVARSLFASGARNRGRLAENGCPLPPARPEVPRWMRPVRIDAKLSGHRMVNS